MDAAARSLKVDRFVQDVCPNTCAKSELESRRRGHRPGASPVEPQHRIRPYKIPTSAQFRVSASILVIGSATPYAQFKPDLSAPDFTG
jgi:hypothetical protein